MSVSDKDRDAALNLIYETPCFNETFIALHDPSSVLRRCASDREILQRYRETLAVYQAGTAPLAMAGQLGAYENVINILARGYGVTP